MSCRPLSLLRPPPPCFIPTVGIPNEAISITAEPGATWSWCAGQGVHAQLVALNTAPELRKQPSVAAMNQPSLLHPPESISPQHSPTTSSVRQQSCCIG